jgi:hypothetical protein
MNYSWSDKSNEKMTSRLVTPMGNTKVCEMCKGKPENEDLRRPIHMYG